MFPLVHYCINLRLLGEVPHLTALGGLWPDLAVGAGGNRDEAHYQGADFYAWCRENYPEALPAAWGILCHGIDPPCVDYYADEFWPDCVRGYMFRQALPYLPQVAACTGLDGATDIPLLPRGVEAPRSNVWWKAHNFIEMAYEMLTARFEPDLAPRLLEAVRDRDAVAVLAEALQGWRGLEPQRVAAIYAAVPDSYAIAKADARTQAEKQAASMHHRFAAFQVDLPAMTELLEQMVSDEEANYADFMQLLTDRAAEQMQAVPLSC